MPSNMELIMRALSLPEDFYWCQILHVGPNRDYDGNFTRELICRPLATDTILRAYAPNDVDWKAVRRAGTPIYIYHRHHESLRFLGSKLPISRVREVADVIF